jgi:hypothetical protein
MPITLVVCGTLFALVPSISDLFHGYQVSQFLGDRIVQTGITRIHQPMGEVFRVAAWVLGAAMIGVAVLGSGVRQTSRSPVAKELDARFGSDMLRESASRRFECDDSNLLTRSF